jgi:hypothetical protein
MAEFGRRSEGGSVPSVGSRDSRSRDQHPQWNASEPSVAPNFRQPLGVGGILGDAFSIYFQRFGLMFVLSLAPALIAFLIAIAGDVSLLRPGGGAMEWPIALAMISQLLASILSNALIVLAAFDTKIGRPMRPAEYARRAVASVITLILLSLALALIIGVPSFVVGLVVGGVSAAAFGNGAALFVTGIVLVPAIVYAWAAFSPFVAAVVVEGVGFRALGRAWRLTAGYRWPLAGTIVLLFIITIVIELLGGLLASLFTSLVGLWIASMASLAVKAVAGGIMAVGTAMIYARLRGIKEGLDIESLADVFS